jgi:hypothetical protein
LRMRKEDAYSGMWVTWSTAPGYADEKDVYQLQEYNAANDSWAVLDYRGVRRENYRLKDASSAHKPSWGSVGGIPAPDAPVPDPIEKPEHYNSHPSGIELIKIIKDETFLRGNVFKYLWRAPYTGNEVKDLKKAMKYLQWELDRAELASEQAVVEAKTPSPPRASGIPTLPA